jgi:hypothetical protein
MPVVDFLKQDKENKMATQIKTFYIKTGDWQSIFNNVKLQAFTMGLKDFNNFLNQATVDKQGRIQSNWNDLQLDALINDDQKTYNQMEKQSKIIVKQARTLGLKAAYNDLTRLHLRHLA